MSTQGTTHPERAMISIPWAAIPVYICSLSAATAALAHNAVAEVDRAAVVNLMALQNALGEQLLEYAEYPATQAQD